MMFRNATTSMILAAMVFTMPVLAHADAALDATVKDFIAVAHLDNLRAGLAQQTTSSALPLLREYLSKNKVTLSPAQQQKLQANLKGYVDQQHKIASDYFNSASSKSQFNAALTKGYSAQFSNDELKQIITFYQTPAGKKLMEQQTTIINAVAGQMLQAADKGLLPQMRAAAAAYGKSVSK